MRRVLFLRIFASLMVLVRGQVRDDSFHDHYLTSSRKSGTDENSTADEPSVQCSSQFMNLTFQMAQPFHGRIYVEGREHDERCSAEFFDGDSLALNVRFGILPCAIIEESADNPEHVIVWLYVRILFHKTLITGSSKIFRSECSGLTKTEVLDDATDRLSNTICQHKLHTPTFPYRVGGVIFHEWTCVELLGHRNFVMLLQDCVAISKTKSVVQLIDKQGQVLPARPTTMSCRRIIDETLISNLHGAEAAGIKKFTAISQVFKFPGESELRFRCRINMLPQQRSRRLLIVFPNNGSVETSSNSPDRLLDNEKTIPQTVTTLTDWIEVRESQQAEELFGGTEPNWAGAGSLLSLDDLYDSKEKPGHELNLATDARAESLTSQEVPHATKTSIDEDFSTTAKEPEAKQSPNVTLAAQNKANWCTYRLLNNLLLVWSIFSVLVFVILLAVKIYRHMMKVESRTSHLGPSRRLASNSSHHFRTLAPNDQLYPSETNEYWRKNAF